MAEIVAGWRASDGWDARCVLSDGRTEVFHIHGATEEPEDLQAFADKCEAAILAGDAADVAAGVVAATEVEVLRAEVAELRAAVAEKDVALAEVQAELAVAVALAEKPVEEVKPDSDLLLTG